MTAGFGGLLRSEWTKLRSVPRWTITLLAAIGLTVLVALLTAAGSVTSHGGGGPGDSDDSARPPSGYVDAEHFAYRELTGNGELVARVASQRDSGPWAKAGLMVRANAKAGARYAAVMVTPGHGVRMQADFTNDVAGAGGNWLKITRSGTSVTGFSSADGTTWQKAGTFRLDGLPATVHIGLFVASPDETKVERQFGGESVASHPTEGQAVFDRITPAPTGWKERGLSYPPGRLVWADGSLTLTGSGDIGADPYAEDVPRTLLTGALLGLVAVVGVAVLFVTAEYRRGMVLTTFTVTPRRERVLAAKALVLAGVTFVVGVVAALGALVTAGAVLRGKHRYVPPITDAAVLRAAIGTGLLVALVAVFGLGLATLLRNTAAAVSLALVALLVPQIAATGLPLSAGRWMERLTPAAGFAIQQTVRRYDTALGPWTGLAVLAGWAALVLALAARSLARRDA